QFRPVQTDVGMDMIQDGRVEQATIVDGEQRADLVLSQADAEFGQRLQFHYVGPRGDEVVEARTAADPSCGYIDEVPQANWLLSMFGILLPVLLLGGLFYFIMTRMAGGNKGVMQFGKSKAKLITKDMPQVKFADVAG